METKVENLKKETFKKRYNNNLLINIKSENIFHIIEAIVASIIIHLTLTITHIIETRQLILYWGTINYIILLIFGMIYTLKINHFIKLKSKEIRELYKSIKDFPELQKETIKLYEKQGFIIKKQEKKLNKITEALKEEKEFEKINNCIDKIKNNNYGKYKII